MQRMHRSGILISALVVLALAALDPASVGSAAAGAATPAPDAPPATWDELLEAGLEAGLIGLALRVGHEGDGPGAGARMFRLAELDLTVVLLTNTGGADETVGSLFAQAVWLALGPAAPNG